jgi:hypothetical protein
MKKEPMKNMVIRGYESQIEIWEKKARSLGPTVAWWVKRALNAAATGHLKVKFTERQFVRGRVESDEPVQQLQVRVTKAEHKTWTAAADAEGLDRAEWARQVLDAAAARSNQVFLVAG